MPSYGTREQRGYGWQHRKMRAAWKVYVDAGQVACARCGQWIPPGSRWDLGHFDLDRGSYMGPEHARCNRGAARRRTRAPKLEPRID